ncbi:hypothetical protein XYCOK13_41740 [Xylanibacillus composti]|uniref:Uncharacterized protein n=1 Tax=Xylanibacillus composti TaxID=1572762 RepID=A0A8J4H7L6_9BACL|nr:hypothetical protein [Xylanibacillus composti]GIQ71350.1 hypothetical protein XYCOK13_41740 [Xylanibacillus composti]
MLGAALIPCEDCGDHQANHYESDRSLYNPHPIEYKPHEKQGDARKVSCKENNNYRRVAYNHVRRLIQSYGSLPFTDMADRYRACGAVWLL